MRKATMGIVPVLLMGSAMPAVGQSPAELRTEQVYFTCAGDTKVQNVSVQQGQVPGWDTTAPDSSVTSGAGCGFYDNAVWSSSLAPDETFRATWEGVHVGNLDTLTVEAHNIYLGEARATRSFIGAVVLTVDGETVVQQGIAVKPVPSATGASEAIRFSVAGLGLDQEEGVGTTARTIRLQLTSNLETQSAWVWDTTEVPSGITFNPDELASVVLTPTDLE